MRLNDLFDRLESQENALTGKMVLAPVLAGRAVSVKIGGVACTLKIEASARGEVRGWGVLEVENPTRARWLRPATRGEIDKYLSLLPAVRFVALERYKSLWLAWPAHRGDARFRMEGPAVIRGANSEANIQNFDAVIARFDGTHFWLDRPNARRSPVIAQYLRESLTAGLEPNALKKRGLSDEERAAYAFALYGPPPEAPIQPTDFNFAPSPALWEAERSLNNWRDDGVQGRISRSLSHSGGQLVSYIERGDVYTVTYRFGDRTHTSTVRADDLSVVTSGICLSGYDNDFDLTSLVGVMREAAHEQPWQFEDYD